MIIKRRYRKTPFCYKKKNNPENLKLILNITIKDENFDDQKINMHITINIKNVLSGVCRENITIRTAVKVTVKRGDQKSIES